MLTHRRHRYLTRWPRRLAFALALALLLAAAWYGWQAWHPIKSVRGPIGQLACYPFTPEKPYVQCQDCSMHLTNFKK